MTILASLLALAGCCTTDDCATVCEDRAVPLIHPLGAVSYAHYHTMEANGEAADFVVHHSDFEPESSELSPTGRDHILEIGARMNGTPFPILVEQSGNEIDAQRKQVVVEVLTQLGNADADQRVMISRPYSDGVRAAEFVTAPK